MRIGIDLHSVTDFMQGTRTYTLNLVEQLLKIDKRNEYYLYTTKHNTGLENYFNHENVKIRQVYPGQRLIRIPFSLPLILARDSIDVFHCQYMAPPLSLTPTVVMMHDIIHEYMPEYYPKTLCMLMRFLYPFSARRASRMLTVSENSKNDIVKYYKIPKENIVVTYNAVSKAYKPISDKNRLTTLLKKYGIKTEYILHVGRLEPRKNIAGLIKAFHKLVQQDGIKQTLVIAGMKYYQYEQLFNLAKDLDLEDKMIFTGRVEDEELPLLYNGATLFVYPTFAEGFGIPPLEAMACGTPVITSAISSLPEVVQDAGILIDPYDIDQLASAMSKVISDQDLQEKMKKRGFENASKFTWEKTARQTLQVFQDVYNETATKNPN